jgi:hypothetical protein
VVIAAGMLIELVAAPTEHSPLVGKCIFTRAHTVFTFLQIVDQLLNLRQFRGSDQFTLVHDLLGERDDVRVGVEIF